jgi:hypothetical protein
MMYFGMLRRVALVRTDVPPKRRFLQEPHDVTSQKTPFFGYLKFAVHWACGSLGLVWFPGLKARSEILEAYVLSVFREDAHVRDLFGLTIFPSTFNHFK